MLESRSSSACRGKSERLQSKKKTIEDENAFILLKVLSKVTVSV
jgi:hypothetical protein